jgi:hypothetical protein
MDADMVLRLRAAQDMVRLLLGNAEASEADQVVAEWVLDNAGDIR